MNTGLIDQELTEVFEENETVEDIANAERKSDEDSFDSVFTILYLFE